MAPQLQVPTGKVCTQRAWPYPTKGDVLTAPVSLQPFNTVAGMTTAAGTPPRGIQYAVRAASAADPYMQPPGTPRPGPQYTTPRPPAAVAVMSSPSATAVAAGDPYAVPPGTPRPSAADPYLQPPSTPRPPDVFATPPATPGTPTTPGTPGQEGNQQLRDLLQRSQNQFKKLEPGGDGQQRIWGPGMRTGTRS